MSMNESAFRVVVSIIRGTAAGRALSMMANGIQVGFGSFKEAEKMVEEYLDAAASCLCVVDRRIVFGMISIINMTGDLPVIARSELIMSEGAPTS